MFVYLSRLEHAKIVRKYDFDAFMLLFIVKDVTLNQLEGGLKCTSDEAEMIYDIADTLIVYRSLLNARSTSFVDESELKNANNNN